LPSVYGQSTAKPETYSGLSPISFSTAIITSVSRLKRALVASKLSGPTDAPISDASD